MEFEVTIKLKIILDDEQCGPREEEQKYLETLEDSEIWELAGNYSREIK